MVAKIIFPIIAALLPVIVSDGLNSMLDNTSGTLNLVLSGFISLVFLVLIQMVLEKIDKKLNPINKYCGHWVEEMTLYHNNEPIERMIGLGIIRYDQATDEYVFIGKTYSLDGVEKYAWSIDYLHSDRDDSMQYVCSVQIPGERSIGQITFYSNNECDGNIWIMDGSWYKFNAYRITTKDLLRLDIESTSPKSWKKHFYCGMMISQKDCPKFICEYSKQKFPPLNNQAPIEEGIPRTGS